MAFYIKGKPVVAIVADGHVITAIRSGAALIWEGVRSCFSKGMWIPKKPWRKQDPWRQNCRY